MPVCAKAVAMATCCMVISSCVKLSPFMYLDSVFLITTHIHTHTHSLTHIHTHTHSLTHIHTHTLTHSLTHTGIEPLNQMIRANTIYSAD